MAVDEPVLCTQAEKMDQIIEGERKMSMALFLGLIWSGLWIAYLYVIMKCFPWEMLHDYPEDVRRASTLPEPTGKQKRNAKIFSGIGSIIIFGALIAFGVLRFRTERTGFITLFWFLFIIAMSWNVVDLLVMVSRAHRVRKLLTHRARKWTGFWSVRCARHG